MKTITKKLYLLSGIQGSGKSTFIKKHGLENHTISTDTLRLTLFGKHYTPCGKETINGAFDRYIFEVLKTSLRMKMEARFMSIVVDACNCDENSILTFKHMADEFGYDTVIIDFNTDLSVALQRNKDREEYKFVPEHVIEKFFQKKEILNKRKMRNVEYIDSEDFSFEPYTFSDTSQFEDIVVFGDLQGCVSSLKSYFEKNPYKEENLYVFVGDYLDRGIETKETMEFVLNLSHKNNIIFLEGNHERHLIKYVNGELASSNEFNNNTAPELALIDKEVIQSFLKKLLPMFLFQRNGKEFVITHTGLPFFPTKENLRETDAIGGIPQYYKTNVDCNFEKNTHGNQIQLHGHNNDLVNTKRSISLEDAIEFGGFLKIATIDKEGNMTISKEKQEVYKKEERPYEDGASIIEGLRSNSFVKEKRLTDRISSFNFTNKAFYKKEWNEQTIQARGLFVDIETNKVMARSFEKFFNLGEFESHSIEGLKKTLSFPIKLHEKENGFLGIASLDENKDFFFASKSTHEGPFAEMFKEIALKDLKLKALRSTLLSDISLVFEVIEPSLDPHIVKYDNPHLVLIGAFRNTFACSPLDDKELSRIAKRINCKMRNTKIVFQNFEGFNAWLNQYLSNFDDKTEGFVVEDNNKFFFKIKSPFYNYWKQVRSLKDRIARDKPVLIREGFEDIVSWLMEQDKEMLLNTDVIRLRELYLGRP